MDSGNMKLKKYQPEDAAVICTWIQDEKSLYQWSASCFGKFPVSGNDINENYAPRIASKRFIPLSAFDDANHLVGHLYIRYPDEEDDTTVRFGFVIIDPTLRGHGNGKKMLQLAMDYAKNTLGASKITLGVFTNNDSARYCYESVGFQPLGETEIFKMAIGEWECTEMELRLCK